MAVSELVSTPEFICVHKLTTDLANIGIGVMGSLSLREKEKDRKDLALLVIRFKDPQMNWDQFWSLPETGLSRYAEDFLQHVGTAPFTFLFEVNLVLPKYCSLGHANDCIA